MNNNHFLVELEDVIAGVTVRQNDVAIRSDRDRRRAPLGQLQSRFFGDAQLQHDVAGLGVELDSFAGRVASSVNELVVPFRANLQVMDVRVVVSQESADHFAFR